MELDDQVMVTCTDTDKTMEGTIVRIRGERGDVAVGELILNLRRTRPGIWLGIQAGMEFVVKDR